MYTCIHKSYNVMLAAIDLAIDPDTANEIWILPYGFAIRGRRSVLCVEIGVKYMYIKYSMIVRVSYSYQLLPGIVIVLLLLQASTGWSLAGVPKKETKTCCCHPPKCKRVRAKLRTLSIANRVRRSEWALPCVLVHGKMMPRFLTCAECDTGS